MHSFSKVGERKGAGRDESFVYVNIDTIHFRKYLLLLIYNILFFLLDLKYFKYKIKKIIFKYL